MDYLISFVVSVTANIAAYIARKWIDKQSHDKIKRSLYGNTAAFFGASSDTAFFENHRSTICF